MSYLLTFLICLFLMFLHLSLLTAPPQGARLEARKGLSKEQQEQIRAGAKPMGKLAQRAAET